MHKIICDIPDLKKLSKVYYSKLLANMPGSDGSRLQSQHSVGRGVQICVRFRIAWSTEQVLGPPGYTEKPHLKPPSQPDKNKNLADKSKHHTPELTRPKLFQLKECLSS